MNPRHSPSALTPGNRAKPAENNRSIAAHRDENEKTDRTRVVSSGASNVLRASPLSGKNGRIPAPSPSVSSNTLSSMSSKEHSKKHSTPFSHSLPSRDSSSSRSPAPSNPSARHTDTFAQKDVILAAKFPQKRKLLLTEQGSGEKRPRQDPRTSSLLRPHHKPAPH